MTSRTTWVAAGLAVVHAALLLASGVLLFMIPFPAGGVAPSIPESQSYSPFALLLDLSVIFAFYVLPGAVVCGALGFVSAALLARIRPEEARSGGWILLWCSTIPFLVFLVGASLLPKDSLWVIFEGTGMGLGFATNPIAGYFSRRFRGAAR